MQPRLDPRRQLIVAHLEHAAGRLDLGPSASPADGRAMQAWIDDEIERAFAPFGFSANSASETMRPSVNPRGWPFEKLAGRGREMMHA
jgi:hypothetical protein